MRSVRRVTPGQARRVRGEPLDHRRVQQHLRHRLQAQPDRRSQRAFPRPQQVLRPSRPSGAAASRRAGRSRGRGGHRRRPPGGDVAGHPAVIQSLILQDMPEPGTPRCHDENVSPTRARKPGPPRIAAELASLGLRPARHPHRAAHPLRQAELPLPRRPARPARPLPPVDPQGSRQDRHPAAHRRPARRLPGLVRQPAAAARPRRRARGPQPCHRRRRPPLAALNHLNTVATARLTRGRAPASPHSAGQAKREDLTRISRSECRSEAIWMGFKIG